MQSARVILLSVCLVAACEGRVGLHISPCAPEGTTQSCITACGEGTRTCNQGSWSGCIQPPVRLPCHNTCGDGTQLCQNGQLQGACDVDPARLPCSNTCGGGTQLCQNGQLQGACEVAPVSKDCSTMCGSGVEICSDNAWHACTAPQPKQPGPPKLTALIRDFRNSFPDMNHDGISETGIVERVLGSDDKPVYAHTGSTATVVGPDTFKQWYRAVDGVNTSTTIDLPLVLSDSAKGVYGYDNTSFFPIDGKLFGNEGLDHNYSFTAEVVTSFLYRGGETFTFSGDDDVFVFINRILAIDLGGIHSILSQTVDLDAWAKDLGISKGNVYSMHIFFAERHPIGSDFVVETTISDFNPCQ
jgi:fibro-slime domain-containing protein